MSIVAEQLMCPGYTSRAWSPNHQPGEVPAQQRGYCNSCRRRKLREEPHWHNNWSLQHMDDAYEAWITGKHPEANVAASKLVELVEACDLSLDDLADLSGVSKRALRDVMKVRRERVYYSTFEKIAMALDREDALPHITEHGTDGWSATTRHCTDCGTYWHPHHAKGLCRQCAEAAYKTKKTGTLVLGKRARMMKT